MQEIQGVWIANRPHSRGLEITCSDRFILNLVSPTKTTGYLITFIIKDFR